jgi:cyclase
VLLDITAARSGAEPDSDAVRDIVSEAFMPIAYGGGVRSLAQAQRLVSGGVEKIVVNSAAIDGYELIAAMADRFGSSSVVLSINVRRDWRGRPRVFDTRTGKTTARDVVQHARDAVAAGAGEVLLNDVTRDGTGKGYDLDLVRAVSSALDVPVIACGGAGTMQHFVEAVQAGASAVAAGSMFVYMGRHRAVMINYPESRTLKEMFQRG